MRGMAVRQQAVEELPHAVAAQGDLRADRHALADLEAGDRLLRAGDHRLLAGDDAQVLDGGVELLGVLHGGADAHVHDDLLEPRDLVDVRVGRAAP